MQLVALYCWTPRLEVQQPFESSDIRIIIIDSDQNLSEMFERVKRLAIKYENETSILLQYANIRKY